MSLRVPLCFLAILALSVSSVLAQPRGSRLRASDRYFTHEVLFFQLDPLSTDSTRTDVFVAIPFNNLSFLNAGDRYVADYGVIVQATDIETEHLVIDRYQEHSVTETFSSREKRVELDQGRAHLSQYNLTLAQGKKYDLRISVRDLTANVTADTTFTIEVPSWGSGPSVSTPMIYRSRKGTQVLPLIGGDVGVLDADEAGIFTEVYRVPQGQHYVVAFAYPTEESTDTIRVSTQRVESSGEARMPVFLSLNPASFWLGGYTLEVFVLPASFDTSRYDLKSLRSNALASSTRGISAPANSPVPFAERDLDQSIEQLYYIATPWEWDSLQSATSRKEKRQALLEFWRKRDPSPLDRDNRPMEVFYKRLEYANFNYGAMGKEGWRTDRGRIYIVLGEPSYIERNPYQATQKPYEVWEYRDLGTRYYFVDQYLLGDYRLVTAPPRQGIFLWERTTF